MTFVVNFSRNVFVYLSSYKFYTLINTSLSEILSEIHYCPKYFHDIYILKFFLLFGHLMLCVDSIESCNGTIYSRWLEYYFKIVLYSFLCNNFSSDLWSKCIIS